MLKKTKNMDLINQLDIKCFEKNYSINTLKSMYLNNHIFYLIIFEEIEIGFIIINKIGETIELIKIAILESYRKNNFAFLSMKQLLDSFEYEVIILEVSAKNTSAIKLYEKLDFKKINIRKSYYYNGDDALIYIKNKL